MILRRLVIFIGIATLLLTNGLSVNAQEEGISSVCIVTGGGTVNDGTFNQFAFEGMKRAEEEFGLNTTYVEPQAPVDYRPGIDGCIQEGYEVVIGVGWTIYDDTLAAARENPGVYFIGVDHFDTAGLPNYVGLDFRDDQAGFLMGALAAQVTETNIIAAVYGPDVPQVVRFRNGYEQGAKYINPDIQVLGVYLDSFETPDRGASTAAQFIGDGVDVIFGVGGPTGTGAITYAAGEGVWVIGVDQDEYVTSFNNGETPGADKVLSSAIKRIDVAVYSMLEVLANGDFENFPGGSNALFSAENGGVDFAPPHDADVPAEYYEKLREIIDLFASGELDTGVDLATGELIEVTPEATEETGS
jgi:basic membrane lipoprotein Med (substrate-binding protein (PBP1-ABC) superfamily)